MLPRSCTAMSMTGSFPSSAESYTLTESGRAALQRWPQPAPPTTVDRDPNDSRKTKNGAQPMLVHVTWLPTSDRSRPAHSKCERVGWLNETDHARASDGKCTQVNRLLSGSRPIFELELSCRTPTTGGSIIPIGVSNIGQSAKFYDAALGALGLRALTGITKTFEIADNTNDSELGGGGYRPPFRSSG